MKKYLNYRTFTWIRWLCASAIICGQMWLVAMPAAAQEPTTEPTPIPTPTSAPTWTPTPTKVKTPGPARTPTTGPDATPTGRVVDFRVDENKISQGTCVTFSWVVRGDLDRVEFDQLDDGKAAVLVSDMGSREECPTKDTSYELRVTWLDTTRTTERIKVEINGGSDSSDDSSTSGTATPAGTSVFVPVTPVPVAVTPINVGNGPAASQDASTGSVVTPAGALGSVRYLPETGYRLSPDADPLQPEELSPGQADWETLSAIAGGLVILLGVGIVGRAVVARIIVRNEALQ